MSEHGAGQFFRPKTNEPARWLLERFDASLYRVTEEIEYREDGNGDYSYVFPLDLKRNRTDFASIPWFLTWLVPRDGRHTPAAIMHDAFIGGIQGVDYSTTKPGGVSDDHADYLFRDAMRHADVGFIRRWMMWAAVSLRTQSLRRGTGKISRLKVAALIAVLLPWAAIAALMQLQVPGFGHPDVSLGFLDGQPFLQRLARSVPFILAASAVVALLVAAILRRGRPSFMAGGIAGLIIGIFGLPMIASAFGWGLYLVLDNIVNLGSGKGPLKPVILPETRHRHRHRHRGRSAYGRV